MDTSPQREQPLQTTKTFLFRKQFDQETACSKGSGRLFSHRVKINVKVVNRGEIRILNIETLPLFRHMGYATVCLNWLCAMADQLQVQISLGACPMDGERGLDLVDLTAWYQRHGFVRLGFDDEMVRYPKAKCAS